MNEYIPTVLSTSAIGERTPTWPLELARHGLPLVVVLRELRWDLSLLQHYVAADLLAVIAELVPLRLWHGLAEVRAPPGCEVFYVGAHRGTNCRC